MIGLFCRISSLLLGSFAKETYNFKEPANRSHPIAVAGTTLLLQMPGDSDISTLVSSCHING